MTYDMLMDRIEGNPLKNIEGNANYINTAGLYRLIQKYVSTENLLKYYSGENPNRKTNIKAELIKIFDVDRKIPFVVISTLAETSEALIIDMLRNQMVQTRKIITLKCREMDILKSHEEFSV